MFIHEVCSALQLEKIPYAIVGGYAVALHGVIRGTIDVDIVVNWTLENLKKVELVLKKFGLVSLLPINAESVFNFRDEYIQNRHMIAWNFYNPSNPGNQIDILINYDLRNAKVKTIQTQSGVIKVLAKADLIKMKKEAGRPQDLEDVKALENL